MSNFVLSLLVAVFCAHLCAVSGYTQCGPHSVSVKCGKFCEPSCDNPVIGPCRINPAICEYSCRCFKGYVRDLTTGRCVLFKECNKSNQNSI